MMRPLIAVLFLILTGLELFSQSTICSYSYRRKITFNPAQVAGPIDLTDFPVLINIASDPDLEVTTSGGHVQSASGFDIIFTAADGVTVLDHELTQYVSTTGQLQCWVKIPTLSTTYNTVIFMYYGRASATNLSTSNTWSNGYVAVWHFDNSLNNATGTAGLNGTNNGSTNSGTAMFNQSRDFVSGSSQFIEVTPYNSAYDISSEITVSAWLKPSTVGSDQKIVGNQSGTAGGWKFGLFSDNKIEFEIRNSANGPTLSRSVGGGTALAANTWYHVVGQYSNSGDFINTYRNGALDRSLTTTQTMASTAGTLKIGREPFASTAFLNGRIDELRISNVIRSADWIATEYNNQNSPATFYTLSPEPNRWDGSSSTAWGTNANWSSGTVPASYADVIIPNVTNDPDLTSSRQVGSIWIQSGAILDLVNSNTLAVAHEITNCGSLIGQNTSVVELNSSNSYAQTQYLSGSGTYNFINLTINNTFSSSPSIVLNKDINVLGYLNLMSGILYTSSTNLLFMTLGATSSGGSASSFVSGPMSKNGTAAFDFPVGKGNKWRRIGIGAVTASSTFRAEYFDSPYTNTSTVTAPLVDVSQYEYWQLDRVAGTGNTTVKLHWEDAAASGIDNCADLSVARWNGSSWVRHAGSTSGSCSGSGAGNIVTSVNVTSFSPFAFGSSSSLLNPLPIELVKFTAECIDRRISLNWSTATERNSALFEIEKSTDGAQWRSLGSVPASGNSVLVRHYNFEDDEINKAEAYFRLRLVDSDGSFEYSPVVSSLCLSDEEDFILYPNPAGSNVSIEFRLNGSSSDASVVFMDQLGRIASERQLQISGGVSVVDLPLDLQPGVYFVVLRGTAKPLSPKKLIVR